MGARVVGPLYKLDEGEMYLIKDVRTIPMKARDAFLPCRPAMCKQVRYDKNSVVFLLRSGSNLGLPLNSDRILARIKTEVYANAGPRQVLNAFDVAASDGAILWNSNADFRIAMCCEQIFDGVACQCTRIHDPIKKDADLYIPTVPRFRNKEIVEYREPGHETYAIVDNLVDYLITLPVGKLTVKAYRLRMSPENNTNVEDPNKVYTVVDCMEAGAYNNWTHRPKLAKVPQAVQDDLRRHRFDPFYRYGGL